VQQIQPVQPTTETSYDYNAAVENLLVRVSGVRAAPGPTIPQELPPLESATAGSEQANEEHAIAASISEPVLEVQPTDFFAPAAPILRAEPVVEQVVGQVVEQASEAVLNRPASASKDSALPRLLSPADHDFFSSEAKITAGTQFASSNLNSPPVVVEKSDWIKEMMPANELNSQEKANGASVGRSAAAEPLLDANHNKEADKAIPARRSFSGKSADNNAARRANFAVRHDDDDDDINAAAPASGNAGYPGAKFRGPLIIGFLLIGGLVLCFQFFTNVLPHLLPSNTSTPSLSTLFNAGSKQSLSGMWRFAAQLPNRKVEGRMRLHQNGEQLFGEGKDNSGGYFRVIGSVKGNGAVEFSKQYMRGERPIYKPVLFTGQIQPDSEPLFIQGEYQLNLVQGGKWRGKNVTITNLWEADLLKPIADRPGMQPPTPIANAKRPNPLSELGLRLALGMLALAIGIWILLRTGFGPNGWRARLEKAKYVPSQFLAPHRKELNELSKPLKPGGIPLGQRCEWRIYYPWEKKELALPPQARAVNPHILMLGSGDKGKSRLMAKMIAHDIESFDRSVVLIDSDGSLSELLMRWMSAHHRAKELARRVVVIDPTFEKGSLAYNPLEMPEDGDLQGAASSLVYGFKAIYAEKPGSQTQWNEQTANILRSAALLLMINNRTLTDLPTLLQDNDFRDILLEGVEKRRKERAEYATLLETWGQYKKLARTDQWINWVEPILNRITPTLSDPRIRPILTKEVGDINLRSVIKERKILIVKIPQGQLDRNANLLGSLLVTGLKQAALSVSLREKDARNPIALYLDEFPNFIEKETFDAISSDTKKFQIGFVGASKSLQDLPEDFRNQLIINVGCLACFSLAKKDGDMLGPQMFRVDGRKKKHETLQNFINPINTSPQFELISDEEKLNIDRLVGQTERTYFLYRVGTVAGVFHLKTHPFHDIGDKHVNEKILLKMRGLKADN
jgi:hypothetical protein